MMDGRQLPCPAMDRPGGLELVPLRDQAPIVGHSLGRLIFRPPRGSGCARGLCVSIFYVDDNVVYVFA
jgi:hypothetical protein